MPSFKLRYCEKWSSFHAHHLTDIRCQINAEIRSLFTDKLMVIQFFIRESENYILSKENIFKKKKCYKKTLLKRKEKKRKRKLFKRGLWSAKTKKITQTKELSFMKISSFT